MITINLHNKSEETYFLYYFALLGWQGVGENPGSIQDVHLGQVFLTFCMYESYFLDREQSKWEELTLRNNGEIILFFNRW